MQSSDYRIGNWVKRPLSVEDFYISPLVPDQIKAIQVDKTVLFSKPDDKTDSNIPLRQLRGIELTEEWLKKFGFLNVGSERTHVWQKVTQGKPNFDLKTRDDGALCAFTSKHSGIPVTHVHQLQNMYFELTGEEIVTL
jgi:hypothetical protein